MWNEEQLDEALSRPDAALIEELSALDGDIMILGAGGKVGPTLSVMAKRAAESAEKRRKVYAVSRFTDPIVVELLKREGIDIITADLTQAAQVAALPRAENIVFMAGRKFGTLDNASETWAMNVAVPALVTRHFGAARYVVFSTGNVYPFSTLKKGGCDERTPPAPVGEYAMSSLGRERIFEYAAAHYGARVLIYRLNYAVDLRYGVLFDLGQRILAGEPICVEVPAFNCVWQRYANLVALRAFKLADQGVAYLNVTGPETVYVRAAATALAEAMGKAVSFTGDEGNTALLSDAQKCVALFGYPDVGISEMIQMQARWLLGGGRRLGKPTHFEEQRGNF